jgi:hypothetical protein
MLNYARTCRGSYWPILDMVRVDTIFFRNCPGVPVVVWLLSKLSFKHSFPLKKYCVCVHVHITGLASCCAVFCEHPDVAVIWGDIGCEKPFCKEMNSQLVWWWKGGYYMFVFPSNKLNLICGNSLWYSTLRCHTLYPCSSSYIKTEGLGLSMKTFPILVSCEF